MKKHIQTALLLLPLTLPLHAAETVVRAQPETFLGSPTLKAMPTLRLPLGNVAALAAPRAAARSSGTIPFTQLALPALTAAESSALQPQTNDKAFRVGIGRALPASLSNPINLAGWEWVTVAGGQVAHISLTSTGATRVRAQLELGKLPQGVELRFYAPANPNTVFGPFDRASLSAQAPQADGKALFWSPSVEGDTLGMEVFLPTGTGTEALELGIPQLSHLVLDPAASQLKSSALKLADYTSCQQDIACAPAAWQETAKAVARYVFTGLDGASYLCSGTLLADHDPTTQIPYFYTAAHCISDAQTASSMDLFWHYENATCGGNNNTAWTQTTGGAKLLVAKTGLDSSLTQLNSNPPAGVTLAGWTNSPLTANQAVTGIHHAQGLPKKYSSGTFTAHVKVSVNSSGYTVAPDTNGDFSQVVWSHGITAPGSSGSGIWVEEGGIHYLNGTLLGGASECAAPNSPDEYSRFERIYPSISPWLERTGASPSVSVADPLKPPAPLSDGILIARYLQGLHGAALTSGVTHQTLDLTALETRLAALQPFLDIDLDGKIDASKDALLLTRYLLGLRDNALISGFDLSGSARNSAAAITAYLTYLLNPTG